MQSCSVWCPFKLLKKKSCQPRDVVNNSILIKGITIICVSIGSVGLFSQEPDYKKLFGNDWIRAEEFVTENEVWMKAQADRNNTSYRLAVAVIFPELVRYSALRDKIEIALLKTLYINLGEEYANFSIGPFQMKPSFAESIHKDIGIVRGHGIRPVIASGKRVRDVRKYRSGIVEDLEDVRTQFIYLVAFLKICERKYAKKWQDENEKVKFFATVYNCGLSYSGGSIDTMMGKKFFSTRLVKGETYSYSGISSYWYTHLEK